MLFCARSLTILSLVNKSGNPRPRVQHAHREVDGLLDELWEFGMPVRHNAPVSFAAY